MDKTVFTAHIGETDIHEWTQGIGKTILMPILFQVVQELLDSDEDEMIAARIEFLLRGAPKAYDFVVKKDGINDTLDKIMEWAIDEEEYEMCSKIKQVKSKLYYYDK
jgi:hypothetical protein|tara:strand:+ start:263 stop:583 length:321 start_codon:yes stop_codon:yes gene_type:complete